MAINPSELARAVACWLEFEALCGRYRMFSEYYLAGPVSQFLNNLGCSVRSEEPHPVFTNVGKRGRKPAIDFAIVSRGTGGVPGVITDAVEVKWATGKRPTNQELVDDLIRLEALHIPGRQMVRALLVAGRFVDIQEAAFQATMNKPGAPRPLIFSSVFPAAVGQCFTVAVRASQPPARKLWKKAQTDFARQLPTSLKVALAAQYPPNPQAQDFACLIWKVNRIRRRATCVLS